uniref:GB1/RHD3-type G domain-containing protein n=1 Tax=Spermophilus dauricus TaxID=99837 RepID=A0A8C9QMU9_SPEDA
DTPICLVENWNEQLTMNSEALRILDKIRQPVVVVSTVGTYRMGKSYPMNHLAGQNHGFHLGSTVRAETKGIWMWCVPHPSKPNHTLVLLDTEGLGDMEKGDPKNDSWIFVLAVLLSSTFVYKSMGTINHQALEQLHYVTELMQLIRAKSDPTRDEVEDSSEFVIRFFIYSMSLRVGDSGGNLHKCINKETIPCLENAVTTLAQRENSAALQKAADHYSEQMAQRVQFPTDTLQELLEVHVACEREAIAVFMEHSFKDDKQEFQKKLVVIEALLLQNEEESSEYCQDWLMWHLEPLMLSISREEFSVPGGHNFYSGAKKAIEQHYRQVPRKGAKEVLQSFLHSLSALEKSILQSDKALTDGQKAKRAEERAKKEAAEKEQELLRQQQKEHQERMEAQERSFWENVEQLKEKMEREKENILREDSQKWTLPLLQVQEELLTEGFREKSEALTKKINQLKEEIERSEEDNNLSISKILYIAAGIGFLIENLKYGKSVGSILSAMRKF